MSGTDFDTVELLAGETTLNDEAIIPKKWEEAINFNRNRYLVDGTNILEKSIFVMNGSGGTYENTGVDVTYNWLFAMATNVSVFDLIENEPTPLGVGFMLLVRQVQRFLNSSLGTSLEINGKYNESTKKAIDNWVVRARSRYKNNKNKPEQRWERFNALKDVHFHEYADPRSTDVGGDFEILENLIIQKGYGIPWQQVDGNLSKAQLKDFDHYWESKIYDNIEGFPANIGGDARLTKYNRENPSAEEVTLAVNRLKLGDEVFDIIFYTIYGQKNIHVRIIPYDLNESRYSFIHKELVIKTWWDSEDKPGRNSDVSKYGEIMVEPHVGRDHSLIYVFGTGRNPYGYPDDTSFIEENAIIIKHESRPHPRFPGKKTHEFSIIPSDRSVKEPITFSLDPNPYEKQYKGELGYYISEQLPANPYHKEKNPTPLKKYMDDMVFSATTSGRVKEEWLEFKISVFKNYSDLEFDAKEETNQPKKRARIYQGLHIFLNYARYLSFFLSQGNHPKHLQSKIDDWSARILERFAIALNAVRDDLGRGRHAMFVAEKHFQTMQERIAQMYLNEGGLDKNTETLKEVLNEYGRINNSTGRHRHGVIDNFLGIHDHESELYLDIKNRNNSLKAKNNSIAYTDHILEHTKRTKVVTTIVGMMATYDMFYALTTQYGWVLDKIWPGESRRDDIDKYYKEIESIFYTASNAMRGLNQEEAYIAFIDSGAMESYLTFISREQYRKDLTAISERAKTLGKVELILRLIAIIILSSIAARIGSLLIGELALSYGAGTIGIKVAMFAAEVITYTIFERGLNEMFFGYGSDKTLIEDLFHNTLMFGAFRVGGPILNHVLSKGMGLPRGWVKVGNYSGMFISMQGISEVSFYLDPNNGGRWMNWDERLMSLMSNLVVMVGLHLGNYLGTKLADKLNLAPSIIEMEAKANTDISDEEYSEYINTQNKILEYQLELNSMSRRNAHNPKRITEIFTAYELLFNTDLIILEILYKAGRITKAKYKEAKQDYENQLFEMQSKLIKLGVNVKISNGLSGKGTEVIGSDKVSYEKEEEIKNYLEKGEVIRSTETSKFVRLMNSKSLSSFSKLKRLLLKQ